MEHGNVCILTAYCARGSLEDVLQNGDLHLDNMFIASLVADLIKVSVLYIGSTWWNHFPMSRGPGRVLLGTRLLSVHFFYSTWGNRAKNYVCPSKPAVNLQVKASFVE